MLTLVLGAGGAIGCGSSSTVDTAPGQYSVQIQAVAHADTPAAITHSQTVSLEVP